MSKESKGWFINGCFLDFGKPVTYEEALKVAPKSGGIPEHKEPTEFMVMFRNFRLDNKFTLMAVSKKTNIKPGRLCNLEYGRAEPTEGEKELLTELYKI